MVFSKKVKKRVTYSLMLNIFIEIHPMLVSTEPSK